jgi:hypothetical protein
LERKQNYYLGKNIIDCRSACKRKDLHIYDPIPLTFVLSKDKKKLPALMVSIIVFVGYVMWRKLFGVGDEYQVSEGAMLRSAGHTIAMNISAKSVALSWLPAMVIFRPLMAAWRVGVQRTLCLGVAAGAALLLCLAVLADVGFWLGRILFTRFPAWR